MKGEGKIEPGEYQHTGIISTEMLGSKYSLAPS